MRFFDAIGDKKSTIKGPIKKKKTAQFISVGKKKMRRVF